MFYKYSILKKESLFLSYGFLTMFTIPPSEGQIWPSEGGTKDETYKEINQ